jgi:chemotaxis protein histidine kinase CheA
MSSALKQVIVNAVIKIAGQNPAREIEGEPTIEEARDEFIRLLIAELFPESPAVPVIKEKKKPGPKPKLDENGEPIKKPKSPKSPDSLEPKERKPRTPMSEEAKAAMVAKRKATVEAKKDASPGPVAEAPAEPKPKKEKTAEEKAAIAAKRKTTVEAKKAAEPATPEQEAAPKSPPKAPKKPKKAPEASGTANLDKFTPTQTKKLKEIVGETADKKTVLAYLNGLSNAAYNDKKLEDHFRDYAASLAPPAPAPEPETQQEEVSLVETDFDGETYYVNPATGRVYTMDETGTHPVGYVGMAKFADMEMPTEDEGEE